MCGEYIVEEDTLKALPEIDKNNGERLILTPITLMGFATAPPILHDSNGL